MTEFTFCLSRAWGRTERSILYSCLCFCDDQLLHLSQRGPSKSHLNNINSVQGCSYHPCLQRDSRVLRVCTKCQGKLITGVEGLEAAANAHWICIQGQNSTSVIYCISFWNTFVSVHLTHFYQSMTHTTQRMLQQSIF